MGADSEQKLMEIYDLTYPPKSISLREALELAFQAGVESAKAAIQFIFNLLETYGSIGECPYEASSDLEKQIKTYHCYGCNAEGYSSWPDWKVEFTHEPNCKWVDVASLSLQGRKQEK